MFVESYIKYVFTVIVIRVRIFIRHYIRLAGKIHIQLIGFYGMSNTLEKSHDFAVKLSQKSKANTYFFKTTEMHKHVNFLVSFTTTSNYSKGRPR